MKVTNKDLQRMKELMGNKKPINENISLSAIELKKIAPNGKVYGVARENRKYFIKESFDGVNFDFIGGVANKTKNQYNSFEEAVRRLNLMVEDTDVLTPDIIEEKKFVIKTKKKKKKAEPAAEEPAAEEPAAEEPAAEESEGEESGEEEGGDFDFGGEEGEEGGDFDFGGEEGEEGEGEEGGDFDFGGEEGEEGEEEGEGEEGEEEGEGEEGDEDLDLDSDDSIKSIQRLTGKLGQKLRDTEDLSSDTMKWVAKSVISALDLEGMDSDDKKDIIRAIKKKKDEGMEEDDFMADEHKMSDEDLDELMAAHDEDDFVQDKDMVDWNTLSDEEKSTIVNYPGDLEKPMMDWDDDACSHCGGLGHNDMTGEECEWCAGTGVDNMDDYMGDYMDDTYGNYEDPRDHGPGNTVDQRSQVILDDEEENCSYCGDRDYGKPYYDDNEPMGGYPGMGPDWRRGRMDYMGKHAKNVKKHIKGKPMEPHEKDEYLKKIQNRLGGEHIANIEDNKVVGDFGFIKVTTKGFELHANDEKVKYYGLDDLGKMIIDAKEGKQKKQSKRKSDKDYMEDDYYGSFEKNRWFNANDSHSTVEGPSYEYEEFEYPDYESFRTSEFGQDPKNKWFAKGDEGKRYFDMYASKYGPMKVRKPRTKIDYDETSKYFEDYMEDDNMEVCHACEGKGHERGGIGFKSQYNPCISCAGTGRVPREEVGGEVDEPYVDPSNPMGYGESSSTLPKGMGHKFQYKEKFNLPFDFQENSKGKRIMKEDHINDKMASYEQEMAYEDVEAMARQHGMDVEFCHKDRSKDPEEQTVYLDLMKKGKAVAKIRINSAGNVEMGSMKGKVFKGEPVDSHSDFDEVLGEKNIKAPMSPAPAPAKPQTRPETPVKPGRPDTDKPSPSKRPFTPPPHITPGEEPDPKAWEEGEYYGEYEYGPMSPAPAPARPETRPETPVKPAKPDTDRPSPSKRPFTPPPHITPGEEPDPKARFRRK